MQNRILLYNSISPLFYQISAVVCGFILPRLILSFYGTEVNGLVNSIAQFLSIISFLELGIGAVVQSSLYKPLSNYDNVGISKVITSADRFFRKLGYILVVYVLLLILLYPLLIDDRFSFIFIGTLVVAISIKLFAQYFFGITNRLLLLADQKGYIYYIAQAIAVIVNTALCYVLISYNSSVQLVYFTTSIVFLVQPIVIHLYVSKEYLLNRCINYDSEPIKQKWNGIAQHVAAVILSGSGSIILTMFSTLVNVSIYTVYYLPVSGSKMIIMSMISGVQALIGNLWAKKDIEELKKVFAWTEWLIHTGTTVIFTVTAVLIVPFVKVYTKGVNDADYVQMLFAVTFVFANSLHCFRLPYNIMILAAGHYRETQNNYIIATIINVTVSIIGVIKFGLVGVSLGAMFALGYQTIWMAWYNSKNFINWPLKSFYKQVLVDLVTALLIYISTSNITAGDINYYSWFVLALKVFSISVLCSAFVNYILYRDKLLRVSNKLKNTLGP